MFDILKKLKPDRTQQPPADDGSYTKYGFGGLSLIGKAAFIAILIATGMLVWLLWARGDFAAPSGEPEKFLDSFRSWLLGIAKILGVALVVAYAAHFRLPRKTFYRRQFFCADCGSLLGFKIVRCPRVECGSNRYTTDSELANRRRILWEKQHPE